MVLYSFISTVVVNRKAELMKEYDKIMIEMRASHIYKTSLALYGLTNSKKIIAEVTKMLDNESKRRKEKE